MYRDGECKNILHPRTNEPRVYLVGARAYAREVWFRNSTSVIDAFSWFCSVPQCN